MKMKPVSITGWQKPNFEPGAAQNLVEGAAGSDADAKF